MSKPRQTRRGRLPGDLRPGELLEEFFEAFDVHAVGAVFFEPFDVGAGGGGVVGFEEEDGYLTEVEVNEVLSLMGDVRSKVSSYNSLQLGWELCNLGNLDKFIG